MINQRRYIKTKAKELFAYRHTIGQFESRDSWRINSKRDAKNGCTTEQSWTILFIKLSPIHVGLRWLVIITPTGWKRNESIQDQGASKSQAWWVNWMITLPDQQAQEILFISRACTIVELFQNVYVQIMPKFTTFSCSTHCNQGVNFIVQYFLIFRFANPLTLILETWNKNKIF